MGLTTAQRSDRGSRATKGESRTNASTKALPCSMFRTWPFLSRSPKLLLMAGRIPMIAGAVGPELGLQNSAHDRIAEQLTHTGFAKPSCNNTHPSARTACSSWLPVPFRSGRPVPPARPLELTRLPNKLHPKTPLQKTRPFGRDPLPRSLLSPPTDCPFRPDCPLPQSDLREDSTRSGGVARQRCAALHQTGRGPLTMLRTTMFGALCDDICM